ncbi:tRNA cyclic N6-threonylcarbamoyladenosine(37) synthase TcdA [Moritella marina ATCC 15381]|uniref:tRNA threonylcarbamoyladenosine dehydratase n=1 Tax=Moritella marina ATCC 15381 TaxID=1202962 RepID=A0A5J6WQV8_MORMI|nr:tRNA cyclic N6-threonylcarbamoyladenosine(37) synthase TcdA [Moritella marina]QFI39608.1 tRNA cyclic N6-threonylcarbamoyladenosine(37) synthase TcdA [Moritella marina ATCC 15381]
MSAEYDNRFSGIARLYGAKALQFFSQAHVCVIGIGGVGSWAAETLARSGIGKITLIDMDDICVTNTNRQIHALKDTIGKQKIDVMAERIRAINPECIVTPIDDFITVDEVGMHISKDFDYVVDAIDSVRSKTALLAHCNRKKIKCITIGAAGGQIDPTQIQVLDLSRTHQDPLAAKVRSDLRRLHNFSKNPTSRFGIECVFSTEQLIYPGTDGEVCSTKNFLDGATGMDCSSGFGSSTAVTASFGLIAASRVLKKLAEREARYRPE